MASVAEQRAHAPEPEATLTASAAEVMELILQATAVIFANGETTEQTVAAARQIGHAFGYRATLTGYASSAPRRMSIDFRKASVSST